MFCDESFTPWHQLKHKRSQLLVMEMDDEEPVDEEIEIIEENSSAQVIRIRFESPQLSMNALTGVSNYQTIRVNGLHNKKLLQILIDSGSTHNFLVVLNWKLHIFVRGLHGIYNKLSLH